MVLFMVNQELNGALLPIGFLADSFSSFIVINHIDLVRIADELFMLIAHQDAWIRLMADYLFNDD